MVSPSDYSTNWTDKFKNVSLLAKNESIPQRPYNINHQYFLHIDHNVPFDLDQVYFTPHITEDGIYFKIVKDTKNKVIGNYHEANNQQDCGE